MAGKKDQKKWFWSDDEKRSICAQTIVPGVSIAQVARRYSVNANLQRIRTVIDLTGANAAQRNQVLDFVSTFLNEAWRNSVIFIGD